MSTVLDFDWRNLHPKAVTQFRSLANVLASLHEAGALQAEHQLFEGFRSPLRQNELLRRKTTKAAAWQSAHQYGLACDFVPKVRGLWTWDAYDGVTSDRAILKREAENVGLVVPISWDPYHVEHPLFEKLKPLIL